VSILAKLASSQNLPHLHPELKARARARAQLAFTDRAGNHFTKASGRAD